MVFSVKIASLVLGTMVYSISLFGQAESGSIEADALDARALKHYSTVQIDEIRTQHPQKLRQVNFYYRNSFSIKENPACENCALPDASSIDVYDYEHLRQWDRENTVQLGTPGHFLVLMSRKDLQEIYKTL